MKRVMLPLFRFTNHVRFVTNSLGDRLFGTSDFLKVGDTVQISQSKVNDGLYTITSKDFPFQPESIQETGH